MDARVYKEIEVLRTMTVTQLHARYAEVFGEQSRSNHKQFLFRRIAWRLQELAEGGLSERARRRALEIANDADLRIRPPRSFLDQNGKLPPASRTLTRNGPFPCDPRLPAPGTLLVRHYKGRAIVVEVLAEGGFKYDGDVYRSLSAIATKITGTKWNGFSFFNIGTQEDAASAQR